MPDTSPKVAVITLGYVYDTPGAPPLKIGTRLTLSKQEAHDLRAKRLVRFVDEKEAEVQTAGPNPDPSVKPAPPPPAPPVSDPVLGADGKPAQPPKA